MRHLNALRKDLVSSKPSKITQAPFDYDDAHLRRLLALGSEELPRSADLTNYAHDLRYAADIQADLLHYLLPICLEVWCEDLRGRSGFAGFVEDFYPALARPQVQAALGERGVAVVSAYMADRVLEEIDDQRGLSYRGMGARPYRWIAALTTHGVLFDNIARTWNQWWALRSTGAAVGAAQYLSCLMYGNQENPVFAPWTPKDGGGPPCLWEFAGHLYEHRWLQPNVVFLKAVLRRTALKSLLVRVVEALEGEPGQAVATEMLQDWPLCADTLSARCEELPDLLFTEQTAGELLCWTV